MPVGLKHNEFFNNDFMKTAKKVRHHCIVDAITKLLGVVVNRIPDAPAYARQEPALIARLLELRRRLIEVDLGEAIATACWARG